MSAFYTIDKERRLVMTSGAGPLTREDVFGHMNRLSADPDFEPDFCQLADFRHITDILFGPEEVRQFAERDIYSPSARRAFLVRDDLQFGLARMFEIHRELRGETGIRVFRTLDEALGWVLQGQIAS
jgi:hypothetical protein